MTDIYQERLAQKYGGTLRQEGGYTILDLAGLPMTDGNLDALFEEVRPRRDVLSIDESGARIVFDHPDALGEAAGVA